MNKEVGIYQKYEVKKLSNPEKKMDCIVLEWDDPLAWDAIEIWGRQMSIAGYEQVWIDVRDKLKALRSK